MLESQLNELASRETTLTRAVIEVRNAFEVLKIFPAKKESEVLIPLGSGLYVKASPPRGDKFLVNVGGNVVVEKELKDTKEYTENRLKGLENVLATYQSQRLELQNRVTTIRNVISGMVQQ
tara:strand:+ start:487 stop:849 length:363 start_codon:yes stop_codon:yes gene_type:complete